MPNNFEHFMPPIFESRVLNMEASIHAEAN
jgi:hypothetical protein